jgi:tRNA (mo5U34)-methyltransferase
MSDTQTEAEGKGRDFERALLEKVKSQRFYQKIDLPDGSTTNGAVDHRSAPALLGLDDGCVRGRPFLDIASNDGFWAFWAERQGASRSLAIDVEKYEHYDWGMHGVPPELLGKAAKNENFDQLHSLFESSVERQHLSVYELDPGLHGRFDVSVCYGLLYHLRHPLLAIDKVRAVTTGMAVFNTHSFLARRDLPYSVFFLDDVFANAITNWTGASESCVVHWMRDAGFNEVFVEKSENPRPGSKVFSKIYVGCVSDEHAARMHKNPRFFRCDDAYYQRSRQAIQRAMAGAFEDTAVIERTVAETIDARLAGIDVLVEGAVRTAVERQITPALKKAMEEQEAEARRRFWPWLAYRRARKRLRILAQRLREE